MANPSTPQFPRPRKLSVLVNYEKSLIAAFKWDCEAMLEQFEKECTLNYADFANIWQLNHFTFIYADQTFVGPLKVLCEVCFMTVKKYIMFPQSIYIKVGAFYLLYGLYYKQPIEGLVKIRLTLAEYKKIKLLMNDMVNRGQYDILYIFAKMISDNVFLYVAEPKPINIELNRSIKTVTHLDDTFQSRNTESSVYKFQDILQDDTVKALQKTCSEYNALLKKFAAKHPSVLQFKSSVIDDLKQARNKVFAQVSSEANADLQPEETTEIKNTRQSIRLRAMANANAEYRGSKKVITAMDLDDVDCLESDDDTPRKNTRKSRRLQAKSKQTRKGGSKKKLPDLIYIDDEDSD